MPASDMCSVRGIGVADQREHVDLEPQLTQQLLLRDAEPLLLIDDDEAELLGITSRRSRRCVPMRISTLPGEAREHLV